jgi:hypothetical protein
VNSRRTLVRIEQRGLGLLGCVFGSLMALLEICFPLINLLNLAKHGFFSISVALYRQIACWHELKSDTTVSHTVECVFYSSFLFLLAFLSSVIQYLVLDNPYPDMKV